MELDKKELGRRIKQIRQDKGYSQEKVAHLMDSHRNYIGQVERGEVNMSLYLFVRMCGVLGVEPKDLI